MKTHALKKRLETEYSVSKEIDYKTGKEKLCIGSAYVHDLIRFWVESRTFSFAMDTFHEGEKYILTREGPAEVYLKLKEMVESGEINEYLNGNDEGTVPVYYEENGEVIETFCTEPGWPNTTNDGTQMYNNTHFTDPVKCAKYHFDNPDHREWVINDMRNMVQQKKDELKDAEERLKKQLVRFERLRAYLERSTN